MAAVAARHDVVVYEAASRLGGHSHTVDIEVAGRSMPVDTGFIVYNERNYPHLTRLFDTLGVASEPSNMSFSVSIGPGRLEYEGSPSGLVAQPTNAVRPSYWRMLRDVRRFYRTAPDLLESNSTAEPTLGEVIDRGGYSEAFARYHLLPMAAAIWSASLDGIRDFPARSFVRFFVNHRLLSFSDRPRWRTVTGGSREYVRRLAAPFARAVRLDTPVVAVRRTSFGVGVRDARGHEERFDQIVIATHGDQALAILGADATAQERSVLGAFRYQTNCAVLHWDTRLMPRRRRVWASWNYLTKDEGASGQRICVSYWMNRLQNLADAPADHRDPQPVPGTGTRKGLRRFPIRSSAVRPRRARGADAASRHSGTQSDLVLRQLLRLRLSRGRPPGWVRGRRGAWRRAAVGGRRCSDEPGRAGGAPVGDRGRRRIAARERLPVMTVESPVFASCLYAGRVMHKRLRPFAHRFTYRVFSLFVALDELPRIDRRLRLFSHNRWNVFSFRDRDHGPRDGSPLRPWIERHLADAGIDLAGGPVRLLCFPRVLGYVFNPLSIWFCYHADGRLRAVLYEVSNTFGQWHSYLLPVDTGRGHGEPIVQSCDKRLYVSPFIGMTSQYQFRLAEPDERLAISIRQWVPEGEQLIASQHGRRVRLSDRALLRLFVAYPMMTLKVIAGIHWEALQLWRKGARVVPRPAPASAEVTMTEPLMRSPAE